MAVHESLRNIESIYRKLFVNYGCLFLMNF